MKRILFALALAGCTVNTTANFDSPPPPPPGTCVTSNVDGCGAGAIGYACTSDRPDDGDTNLVCSAGRAGAGGTLYCCLPYAQPFTECTPDETIAGCADPGFGFSCAGATSPAEADSRIACSAAIGSSFCCMPANETPACVPAPSVGCAGASAGFACAGDDSPGANDAPIACSGAESGEAGSTTRCCVPFLQSPDGCEENQHAGCLTEQLGFTCAGLHQPSESNAALDCSSSGASTWCCTLH